jgi:hypothetical protein
MRCKNIIQSQCLQVLQKKLLTFFTGWEAAVLTIVFKLKFNKPLTAHIGIKQRISLNLLLYQKLEHE